MKKITWFICLFYCSLHSTIEAQSFDFSKAGIAVSSKLASPQKETFVRVLQEEIKARTQLNLLVQEKSNKLPLIALVLASDVLLGDIVVPKLPTPSVVLQKEGFGISIDLSSGRPILWLIGGDERGVLFAIGEFLRKADLNKQKIVVDKTIEIVTAPKYAIRGHQIGYRNTANSWDAWNEKQYEQYIRELALFGSNSIENIPLQDGPPGPHMKIPREEMNIKMSQICMNYGLDYWVWTPADIDLSDQAKFKEEVKVHSDFYKQCP